MESRKLVLLNTLRAFVRTRPGFDFANYGSVSAYRADARRATGQLHDAERLLAAMAWREGISADDIIRASRTAFMGRLGITEPEEGKFSIDYCAGQYYPTEYRQAVASVLAAVFWGYWRAGSVRLNGDDIRAIARREFGASFARRYFN